MFTGDCAIGSVQSFDTPSFDSQSGMEVTGFQPYDYISTKNIRRMDKISQITFAAARLTFEEAGIQVNSENSDRSVVIILGTSFSATDVTVQFAERF
jgi:3-oxoacyl-[acyl-carrier-protein] synthase II